MYRLALVAGFFAMTNVLHAADPVLHASLQRVAHERVFFGHQSVGANILQGVKELSAKEGVPVFIKDQLVPEIGDPLRKLLKFCYVDINANTDAGALFDQYRRAVNELRAGNPRTVFVHATLALTTVQTGPKAWVKRLLGRSAYGTVENVRRDEYNRLLRATYAGREPIFDLARIESTAPDGTLVTVTWDGVTAPALSPEYSADGGHLNARGRLLAAREFITVLAQASSHKIGGLAAATR